MIEQSPINCHQTKRKRRTIYDKRHCFST